MLYKFLELLWRGGSKSYWWTSPNRQSYWFPIKPGLDFAQKKFPKAQNQDIYFGVHPSTRIPPTNSHGEDVPIDCIRSQNEYIAAINCVYADFDDTSQIDCVTQPSVIISSGGGLHCYWIFDEPFIINTDNDREYAKKMQANWVTHVGSDPGAKDFARVLRVPGTHNYKEDYAPDYPMVDFVKCDLDCLYNISEFEVEPIIIDKPKPPVDMSNVRIKDAWFSSAIDGVADDMKNTGNGSRNDNLNKQSYRMGQFVPHGVSQSDAEAILMSAALETGLPEGEIISTMKSGMTAGMKSPDYGPQDTVPAFSQTESPTTLPDDAPDKPPTIDEPTINDAPWEAPKTENEISSWLIKHGLGTTKTMGKLSRWKFDSCPTSRAHDDGAVLSLRYGIVSYKCEHASCKHHDWYSLLAMYDGDDAICPQTQSEKIKTSLRKFGTFALNRLEDIAEVNGHPIGNTELSQINFHMLDCGHDKKHVVDAINTVSSEISFHPIRDYLSNLTYDGGNELQRMLSFLTGDNETINGKLIHEIFITKWLLGCVARVVEAEQDDNPFKHQNPMLILSGEQNIGKSSWVRWLCSGVGFKYHREGQLNATHAEDLRCMVNKWIWEVSEFSVNHKSRDATKALITQENHTYRIPYDRLQITKPTLCNLVSTINPQGGVLNDTTGERRYMPVNIWAINQDYSEHINVNAMWAELYHMYTHGASPKLTSEEDAMLNKAREQHRIENPLEEYITMYFDLTRNPADTMLSAEIIQHLEEHNVRLGNSIIGQGMNLRNALSYLGIEKPKGYKYYAGIKIKRQLGDAI